MRSVFRGDWHSRLVPYSKQQSASWEVILFSDNQEISSHYMEHAISLPHSKCTPRVRILRQLRPFYPPHFTSGRSILILSSHLRLALPNGLFPSSFPTKTPYTTLLSPKPATCTAHLILLVLSPEQYLVRSTGH